jgi:broad specificity phosphatase PhoE
VTTVFLVRHGENPANISKEFSCRRVDYSLTAKGVEQARQTGAYFRDKGIRAVFASPLKRARETAAILGEALGLPVSVLDQLRENDVGELEGMPPTEELWALHDRIVHAWFDGKHEARFPGGEDYLTLVGRMRDGLRCVLREHPTGAVVVVGHGGIFTATIKDLCDNVDITAIRSGENHNCSISELELTLDAPTGVISGELKRWAACDHLSGVAADFVSGTPALERRRALLARHRSATAER